MDVRLYKCIDGYRLEIVDVFNQCDYAYTIFVSEALASMGYSRSEIEDSLGQAKYDDVFATYLLLGRKTTDVRITILLIDYNYLFQIQSNE